MRRTESGKRTMQTLSDKKTLPATTQKAQKARKKKRGL
jgi:hypothetical protein